MLIRRLVEAYDHLDVLPTRYNRRVVRYLVMLPATKRTKPTLVDLASPESKNGEVRPVPDANRTSSISPHLLSDNCMYTFGKAALGLVTDPTHAQERNADQGNAAYAEQLGRCARDLGGAAKAVMEFLGTDPLDSLQLPANFEPDGVVCFAHGKQWVTDLPEIQSWWARDRALNDAEGEEVRGVCHACLREGPLVERYPVMVKGIPGGQANMALVAANLTAFESYRLRSAHNSPTCFDCAERSVQALNALLADKRTSLATAGSKYVFWSPTADTEWVGSILDDPEPDEVKELLKAPTTAKPKKHNVDPAAFYLAGLRANISRVQLRTWIETTLPDVQVRLADWFDSHHLNDNGGRPRYSSVFALAAATARTPREVQPGTTDALYERAICGTPVPAQLLARVLDRIPHSVRGDPKRSPGSIPENQAALVRLALADLEAWTIDQKENFMTGLDTGNAEPAYLCGRLLSILDGLQADAIGTHGRVASTYYKTASTAPAVVFGRLLADAQVHIAKLAKSDQAGRAVIASRWIGEITDGLEAFPDTFTIREQGLFALGYYHQRQERFRKHAVDGPEEADGPGVTP